jgi:hypothetical protein
LEVIQYPVFSEFHVKYLKMVFANTLNSAVPMR